jgi:hypothetical protein
MYSKVVYRLILGFIFVTLLVACNTPNQSTAGHTAIPPTAAPISPTATPIPPPATPSMPTAIFVPGPHGLISETLIGQMESASSTQETFNRRVSPDGWHWAYILIQDFTNITSPILTGNNSYVVVDGKKGKSYNGIGVDAPISARTASTWHFLLRQTTNCS